MELWQRLRHLELGWTGLALLFAGWLAVLFARRLLPASRRHRGRATVVLLGIAPWLHLAATACGMLGLPSTAAAMHITNVLLVVLGITGAMGLLVFDLALGRSRVPTIVRDLSLLGAFALIVVSILRRSGFHPLSLVATSAVLTAVIGLALQGPMSNVFAGLLLQVGRAVSTGDWIQLDARTGVRVGRLMEIGWRCATLETREGDTVVVPNATLLTSEVLNLSRPTTARRVAVRVAFHHRHSPGEVRAALVDAVAETPGVSTTPPVACTPADFVGTSVTYAVVFWVHDVAHEPAIDGAVRARIWYAAERAGLEGPCPGEAQSVGANAAETTRRRRALEQVPFLRALDEAPRDALALGARRMRFAPGERILREGDAGRSLFVIASGHVRVTASRDDAEAVVATLGAGEFVGEMSLLTGAVRQATCVAIDEVLCYEIHGDGLREVFAARPELADRVAALVLARQTELTGAVRAASTASAEGSGATLGERIRRFFALE